MKTVYKSKVDIVYEGLIDAIRNGQYSQGDRLIISNVAKEYEVSEIPVREAIRRLESEGFVKIYPNSGAVINFLDKEKMRYLYEIKGILEGYATRLSIDYLTQEDIQELRALNDKMRMTTDDDELAHINGVFHLMIYNSIPNHELTEMIESLWHKWLITKSVYKVFIGNWAEAVQEHEQILQMIENKDYDKIEMFVRQHKLKDGDNFIKNI